MEERVERKQGASRWWADPRVSQWLMILTYVIGGVGIAIGMYYFAGARYLDAVRWGMLFVVGGVGIFSMVRHSLFFESDAARADVETEPFYMIELGFVQGAMGVIAVIAFFAHWGPGAAVALSLAFALYLLMACVLSAARAVSKGLTGAGVLRIVMWLLMIGFLATFAITAAVKFLPVAINVG